LINGLQTLLERKEGEKGINLRKGKIRGER